MKIFTSMTPCSPGMISGLCSISAKASLSSSILDSSLRATTWGLNVFICTTWNTRKMNCAYSLTTCLVSNSCQCLTSTNVVHISKLVSVLVSCLVSVSVCLEEGNCYLIGKKSNIWTGCKSHNSKSFWKLGNYIKCLKNKYIKKFISKIWK